MLNSIIENQKVFQRRVGVPIDDKAQENFLAEMFLFKAIEEIIELRKEFPSGFNPKSKTMNYSSDSRLYEELSDVVLFLVNFMLVKNLSIQKLSQTVCKVQENNFKKLK
jgi:hypothetical protein